MKVFTLRADFNNYRGIYYVDSDRVIQFSRRFDGTTKKRMLTGKEEFKFIPEKLPKGDFPGLSTHIPVFNYRAVEALSDLLQGNGTLFPITCAGENYFIYNVTRVIDALDETNSEIERFDSGRIMDVDRFAFFEERLRGATIFKIPHMVLMDVFVTEPFVDRVRISKLKGFEFRLVWGSD
jgi:hypothetical protein